MSPTRNDCSCARLRRASRAVTQLYDDALSPVELRVTQYALLRALQRHGATRISALAAQLLLDRTALSRNLEPLAARGLVDVETGSDARTREARLTDAGRRALAQAHPLWSAAQRAVRSRIGDARLDALHGLLAELEGLHPSASARLVEKEGE